MLDTFYPVSLTRQQLAQFLPNHEAIKEFERLFAQDTELALTVNNIIEGTGLNDDGTYTAPLSTNYLTASTSLYEADELLDTAIFDYTREYVYLVSTNTALDAEAQTVLVDATSGAINITLPPPVDCFSDNRSFRIAVHKIDTSSNIVTILPNAIELVVGETSQTLELEGEIYNFITDGTNWYLGA